MTRLACKGPKWLWTFATWVAVGALFVGLGNLALHSRDAAKADDRQDAALSAARSQMDDAAARVAQLEASNQAQDKALAIANKRLARVGEDPVTPFPFFFSFTTPDGLAVTVTCATPKCTTTTTGDK
jgi:hypothetical protein